MKRRHLLLAAGLLGPALGCSTGDDGPEVPELETAYTFDVEGRLDDLITSGDQGWLDDLEVEWPTSIELGAIEYEVEPVECGDSCWCSDDRCWTGLATAEVNGVKTSGRIRYGDSSISLLLDPAPPLAAFVDDSDCVEQMTVAPYLTFDFEERSASGTGFDTINCQDWEGDQIVGLYSATLSVTLSEAR